MAVEAPSFPSAMKSRKRSIGNRVSLVSPPQVGRWFLFERETFNVQAALRSLEDLLAAHVP
jgi:hypothetical protein